MSGISDTWAFLTDNSGQLLEQTLEHLWLTGLAVLLAIAIAVPAGITVARKPRAAALVLGTAGVFQTVPSIALLGFLIPVMGIGVTPALFALLLYALLPILRNTVTGLREVDPAVREVAVAMGMTNRQVLWQVELPLAFPVLLAGIRTAAVINVGVATLAAYIGAGGLGDFIFEGIATNNAAMLLSGAVPAALLALLIDQLLGWWQRHPRGVKPNLRNPRVWVLAIILVGVIALPFVGTRAWAGFPPEFMGRPDGYDHLVATYNLDMKPKVLNSSLGYEALRTGEVDLFCGYSSDGRIKAFDLVGLQDDKGVFPPYHCAPLFRSQTLAAHPEIVTALAPLTGLLSDSVMTRLNYEVDFKHRSPAEVATKFLRSKGLWRSDQSQGGTTIRLGGKIFTEQYILVEMMGQLINGSTDLDVELKTNLGGTKICYEALLAGEIDGYPEYTGTGFYVLYQPSDSIAQAIDNQPESMYQFLKDTFKNDRDLTWMPPLGFNNTYALLVRNETARKKGWLKISDLPSTTTQ